MNAFRMHRIPVPDWAPGYLVRDADGEVVPDLSLEGAHEAHAALHARQDEIASLVDRAVNEYVNEDSLIFNEDEDDFPTRKRLNGEYYLGPSFYQIGSNGYSMTIMARCLEKPWYSGQVDCDYLGLNVWINLDPATGSLSISGVDSSVI